MADLPWVVLAVLSDGARGRIRPPMPEEAALRERFSGGDESVSRASGVHRRTSVIPCADPCFELLFEVRRGPGGLWDAVAMAQAIPRAADPSVADVRIWVDEAWRRRGIGGLLARHLAAWADTAGLHRGVTPVRHPGSRALLDSLGWPMTRTGNGDQVEFELPGRRSTVPPRPSHAPNSSSGALATG